MIVGEIRPFHTGHPNDFLSTKHVQQKRRNSRPRAAIAVWINPAALMHDQCAQSVALDTAGFPDQSVVQYRQPETLRHTARDAPVIRMDLLAGPTIAMEVLDRKVAGRIAH